MRIPYIKSISRKAGFISAVGLAAAIGGTSTGLVMAAIPDSNGDVQTCYSNSGGNLRVIDSSAASCGAGETALNLTQSVNNGTSAFFQIRDGVVDTSANRNIVSYSYKAQPDYYGSGWCMQTSFLPAFATTSSFYNQYRVSLRGQGLDTAQELTDICDSTDNVWVPDPNNNPNTTFTVRFEK